MLERKVVIKNTKYCAIETKLCMALLLTIFLCPLEGVSAEQTTRRPAQQGGNKERTVGDLLRNIQRQARDTRLERHQKSNLPEFQKLPERQTVNLQSVQPPARSTLYYEAGTNEAELERVTDEGIAQLFKLTQQFKSSPRRGELWLRLAELYVEKARLIEHRLQTDYDKKVQAFNAGKTKTRPRLILRPAREYNEKAVQLYEWFLRDFPDDSKVDQALFFLGYNSFELGNEAKGRGYYEQLTRRFPNSSYIEEANFSLGEYHFEKEQWQSALGYYQRVAKNRRSRLYSFATYKVAWCQYKLGQVRPALSSLEQVIRVGRQARGQGEDGGSGASQIRLASEAMNDLVVFYAEAGSASGARDYFEKIAGPRNVTALLDRLAYFYADTGGRDNARLIFKQLIEARPTAPKAYEYQHQIVSLYAAAGNDEIFRQELYYWLQNYGPESDWAKANAGDKELSGQSGQLIETTLRNYILQHHQTAQNSRARRAQESARSGYELYFQTFKNSEREAEMRFFYAELLFDMEEFQRAAREYMWIVEKDPQGEYGAKSLLNAMLALDRLLPQEEEIKKIVGDSTAPVEFDSTIKAFEVVAARYTAAFPQSEEAVAVKFKMATLYYLYNQFDKALPAFQSIVREHPRSEQAQLSANLILDIYNLQKDYDGLEKAGSQLLAVPELASSEVGSQVRGVVQRSAFKRAQDLEGSQEFLKSAEAYEAFAKENPNSDLATGAYFNAGVNYEKAGHLNKSIAMYGLVAATRDSKSEGLRKNASKFLPSLYERTGQYARAASAFEAYANQNSKDSEAIAFYYNAAVIQDGMNSYESALRNYQKYFDASRSPERVEALLLMGKIWQRRGNLQRAIGFYERYMESNPRNASGVVEASFLIAQLSERLNRRKAAEDWYGRTVAVQRRLASRGDSVGVAYAAEARFKQVYKIYEELRAVNIPANPTAQERAVQNKLSLLNRLKEELKSVIRYDDGPQIVASLTLIGQAYQHMSAAIFSAPLPSGLDEEGLKQYRAGVAQVAKPFQDDAIKNYEAAIERSFQLEAYGDWTKTAMRELSNLNSQKYPNWGEQVFLTRVLDIEVPTQLSEDVRRLISSARDSRNEDSIVKAASEVLAQNQKDIYSLNALAVFYIERGYLGLARIILNRALEVSETTPALHNNLGVVFLAEDRQRQALRSFRRSIELKPDYAVGAANMGSIYLEFKDYQRALAPLESGYKALSGAASGSNYALEAASNYAVALSGVKQYEAARKIYQSVLGDGVRNPQVLLNYGILLVENLGGGEEATRVLSRVKFLSEDRQILERVRGLESKMREKN